MRQRLLLFVTLLATIYTGAKAQDVNYNIWIGGTQVTSANAGNVLGDGTVSYDAETQTLTLSNANITTACDEFIRSGYWGTRTGIRANQDLVICLVGENTIDLSGLTYTRVMRHAIFVAGDLTINGTGSLNALSGVATNNNSYDYRESTAIHAERTLTFDGQVSVTAVGGASQCDSAGLRGASGGVVVKGNASVVASGSDVTAKQRTSLGAWCNVRVEGGSFVAFGKICACDILTVPEGYSIYAGDDEESAVLQSGTSFNASTVKYVRAINEATLTQDADGFYLIASVQNWRDFAELVQTTPTANARMRADIDLGDDQTTVGTQDVPYAGTFDGNGHTLTVAYSQNISGLAPFRYINGATIQRIHITGTIDTQTGKCAAGIVSYSTGGTTTISECWSSAKLKGDDTMGGICAVIQDGTMNINDCLVDGTISGSNAYNGGFISHPDNTATVNINNGLFLRYADADVYWSGTFFRSDQDWFGPRNLYNCYYFYPYGYPQGIQATEEQLANSETARALQAGRPEQVWVQDMDMGQPMLMVFSKNPDPDGIASPRQEPETGTAIYDLTGRRLSKPQRGLNIIGGKKVVVM